MPGDTQPESFTEQPVLYAKDSKGKLQQWKTWSKGPVVYFEHGKVDGKQQVTHYKAQPTNMGRANARNSVEQAAFESKAAWEKKLKEGYYLDQEDAKKQVVILPMLAHRFDKQGKKLRYPCSMQRKLNGMRCLAIKDANGTRLLSRGGDPITAPHIVEVCSRIMDEGDMLDGELYIHGVTLQNIISLVKRNRDESLALQYHLYDMPRVKNQGFAWTARHRELVQRLNMLSSLSPLKAVETLEAQSEADVITFEKSAIIQGYEGVMLRNHHGEYRFNHRSSDLLKWKRFQDSEFKVIDMKSRIYAMNGVEKLICDVCVCRNDRNEKTFEVVPVGAIDRKVEYWEHRDKYIGTDLVVRYLERSDDGIPIGNPVGVAFRIEEDTGGPADEDDADWTGG